MDVMRLSINMRNMDNAIVLCKMRAFNLIGLNETCLSFIFISARMVFLKIEGNYFARKIFRWPNKKEISVS